MKFKNHRYNATLAIPFTFAAIFSTGLSAQTRPEDAIHYRQSVFNVMAWQLKPMTDMVQGKQPYKKDEFAQRAAQLDFVGKLPLEGFIPGTDKGETKALPEVWTKSSDFKTRMEKMQAETAKLASVARSGDFAKIKSQYSATTATCKNCHDDYKRK